MIKRVILFLIGGILFFTSLPLGTKMVMELFHNQKMSAEYQITNVSEGFPPTESTYNFNDNIIELEETIKDDSYTDPWKYKIALADLVLKINGKEIDKLQEYPIRVEEEALNRYYGEIAYLMLEHKQKDETHFIVLLKKTRELQKKMPNGDIVGWVPTDQLKYTLYAIDKEGNIDNTSFSFNNRDALQTELLNAGAVAPHSVGYYTNAWEGYPSIFFPIIFPFITLLLGLIILIISFRIGKNKRVDPL